MANSEIIGAGQDAAHRAPKKILDVCCGPKGMWFDKHESRTVFMDKRKEFHKMVHPSGTRTANIDPDIIGNFTDIQYPADSFYLVVMDPPHIVQKTPSGMVTKQYGHLEKDWRDMLRKGFEECFRVLRPNGILVFKWNECNIPVKEILELTTVKPLFGHRCGKHLNTHWLCFMKGEESPVLGEGSPAQDTMEICHTAPNSAMLQGLKPHAGNTGTSA